MITAARTVLPTAPELVPGLDECERLLGEHLNAFVQHYGSAALGVINLPNLGPGQLVPAQIRASAVLYWTSEVEQAGLLPFIEALSEGVVKGTVTQPLGNAATELARLWRTRTRRFSASERTTLFARIFGGSDGEGSGFHGLLGSLIRVLMEIGRARQDQGIGHLEARAAVAAQQVGHQLSEGGTGIAGYAARDIVAQIQEALRLLRDPGMIQGLGGGSAWQLVRRHAPFILGRPVNPQRHLTLANAGLPILGWIATEARSIESGTVRIGRAARVIREAETWSAAYGDG